MKFYAAVLIVVLAAVAFAQAEVDMRVEYCKNTKNGPTLITNSCLEVKCNKENTLRTTIACAEANCPNGVDRVEKDSSKPFPHCCPKPVCKL